MKVLRLLISLFLLSMCSVAMAHDIVVTLDGQKVFFNFVSKANKTVEITYEGSIVNNKPTYYEGDLRIPQMIRYNGTIYTVVGIGPKAFAGADKLTGIDIPMGVTYIGDFAFESCTSLSRILFPGNGVEFGQGVFFKCDKIQYVSFGSEWKEVDLKMFRWSDSLTTLTIPAKMERIINSKSVKNLESFAVDINNTHFMSKSGLLYSKNNETLLSCPRAYKDDVVVAEGTKNIVDGAFVNCSEVELVDFPETLEKMSFRALYRMSNLKKVVFRNPVPIMTAKTSNTEVFLLQVTNPEIVISVPKKVRKTYKATLVQEVGEYTDIDEDTPYFVEKLNMPDVKNISAIKK